MSKYNLMKENGCKYFKYINDTDLEIIRVVGIQNNEDVKIKKGNKIYKANFEEEIVNKNYVKLEPDMIASFNIVENRVSQDKTVQDVIIMISNINDLKVGETKPCILARQCVNDVFTTFFKTGAENDREYVGVSMSTKSCPQGFKFEMLAYADKLVYTASIGLYIDDIIDDIEILKMLNINKFDKVFKKLYDDYVDHLIKKYKVPDDIKRSTASSLSGWCSTLYQFVKENNIQNDIDTMFNIISITTDIKVEKRSKIYSLTDEFAEIIGSLINLTLDRTYVIPYSKRINLLDLQMPYKIIRDGNRKLWIMGYITSGPFIDETNVEVMNILRNNLKYLATNNTKY